MEFNPRVDKFLQDKPQLTIIGLYWAGSWRFMVVYFAALLVLGLIGVILE